jgi:hypothetical protein
MLAELTLKTSEDFGKSQKAMEKKSRLSILRSY